MSETAWPALVAALHRAESSGYDPAVTLRSVAAARELRTARSISEVLAWRIGRQLAATSSPGRMADPAEATTAGSAPVSPVSADPLPWVASPPAAPADGENAPLARYLNEAAALITARITELADTAARHRPPWVTLLGQPPHNPERAREWLHHVGVIAAYRDQCKVTSNDPARSSVPTPSPATPGTRRTGTPPNRCWPRVTWPTSNRPVPQRARAAARGLRERLVGLERRQEQRAHQVGVGLQRKPGPIGSGRWLERVHSGWRHVEVTSRITMTWTWGSRAAISRYSALAGSITSQGMPAPVADSSRCRTVCDLPAPVAPHTNTCLSSDASGTPSGPAWSRLASSTVPSATPPPSRTAVLVSGVKRIGNDRYRHPAAECLDQRRRTWAKFREPSADRELEKMFPQVVVGPDGCCLDADTALWVAGAVVGWVIRVCRGGEITEGFRTGTGVFACMLGGADGRTLFVCTAPDFAEEARKNAREASLVTARVDTPRAGLP